MLRGHEGGPLVIGDVMYVHTPFPNIVYALDLNNDGRILWKYEPKQDPNVIPIMCCDTVNRGVAYGDGKIILNQADTTGAALDAKTGKVVWSVKNGDPMAARARSGTHAPIVVKDKVIVGISGGEFGVRGWVAAYNLKDGKLAWQGYSDGPGRRHADRPGKDHPPRQAGRQGLRHDTWEGEQWKTGGGTTWGWYSYDPKLNLVYYGTGNPVDLEPGAAPGRQPLVDDHLRPRRRHRHGEVGLPDDPARRVGLRRRQRDDPRRRHGRQRARRTTCSSTSTATASATRWTARPASCWSPRSTIRR